MKFRILHSKLEVQRSRFKVSFKTLSSILAFAITVALDQTALAAEYDPRPDGDGKFTIGPDYHVDPDLTDRGKPKGKSFEIVMRLADSKIFPGTDKTLDQ